MYDRSMCVILSVDHIYKMNLCQMWRAHKKRAPPAPSRAGGALGRGLPLRLMAVDGRTTLIEFQEKPKEPKSNLPPWDLPSSPGRSPPEVLGQATRPTPPLFFSNGLGKTFIPNMLNAGERMVAYRFDELLEDVGTLESLWDAKHGYDSPGRPGPFAARTRLAHLRRCPPSPPPSFGKSAPGWTQRGHQGCEISGKVMQQPHSRGAGWRGRGGPVLRCLIARRHRQTGACGALAILARTAGGPGPAWAARRRAATRMPGALPSGNGTISEPRRSRSPQNDGNRDHKEVATPNERLAWDHLLL